MAEYKSYETEFKKNLKELDEEIKGAQNDDQLREVRKKVQQLERAIQELVDKMKSDLANGYIKKKDIKEIENRVTKFNGFLKDADGKLKYLDKRLNIKHKELVTEDAEVQPEEPEEDSTEKQISDMEKDLKETADRMKVARQEGNDQAYAEENSRYTYLIEKIDKLKNPQKEQDTPVNDNADKISDLERRLKECAKRMSDAKRDGNDQAYAEENSRYTYLVEEIDKLKNPKKEQETPVNDNADKISDLERRLRECAKRMSDAKRDGNDQAYAEENSRYAYLVEEIDKLKNPKKEQETPVNDNADKISDLERRLRECAKRMSDAKRDGNMQAYAEENSRYTYLVEEIDKLKNPEKGQDEPEKEPGKESDGTGTIIDVYTPVDPTKKPEPSKAEEKKEPKLEFEEILAKIDAAQNALSDADVRRIQNASSPLLPVVVKDKNDWLHNTLRIAANICTFPGRLIGKGISKLLTNKNKKEKLQNIIKNVDGLSEEEFETLKNGLASYKGIEGKVSASVRNAVIQREKREVGEKVSKLNQQTAILNETISKNMESIKAIDKKLENKLLSQDRKDELLAQREELLVETTANIASVKLNRDEASKMQGGLGLHGLEEEDRAAREGSNISGRKLGKRYSDDVELQNKEAEIVKKERLARESGDKYAEVEAYLEHEGLLTDNTSTKNILGIEVSRSQRVHSAGVVHKEYENDDLLKNLMTVGFTAAQIQSIMHQISIQKQVNAHNQQIDSINQTNQANAATHNQHINEIQTTATTTRGTVANAQNQEGVLENITSSTSDHEAIGISNNFTNNWGKTTADIEHHAREAAGTTLPVNEAVNNLNNAIRGEASHFNRTALSNSLEQFIQNGGSQVISNGYNSVYNFINQVQRLGKIAYDQVGHIKISTDVMPFITATIGKFMSSSKMNNQLENKKKEQKESAKQESEVSKEQKSENFELKLDNSEAERDD